MRRSTLALFALLAVATTGCDKIKLAIDKIKGQKPSTTTAARPGVPAADTTKRPVTATAPTTAPPFLSRSGASAAPFHHSTPPPRRNAVIVRALSEPAVARTSGAVPRYTSRRPSQPGSRDRARACTSSRRRS